MKPASPAVKIVAKLTLEHSIKLPAKFSSGSHAPNERSVAEDYIKGFEAGWWRCIEIYSKDVNHKLNEKDRETQGSSAFTSGLKDGIRIARTRVRTLIKAHGADTVQVFLRNFHTELESRK